MEDRKQDGWHDFKYMVIVQANENNYVKAYLATQTCVPALTG